MLVLDFDNAFVNKKTQVKNIQEKLKTMNTIQRRIYEIDIAEEKRIEEEKKIKKEQQKKNNK